MKTEGYLMDGKVVVPDEECSAELAKKGYGSRGPKGLVLEPWEALYLLEKGKLKVLKGPEGQALDFQELLRVLKTKDEWIWVKYLIYRDLRERGYVVKKGFGRGVAFRLYGRGEYGRKTARFLVLSLIHI